MTSSMAHPAGFAARDIRRTTTFPFVSLACGPGRVPVLPAIDRVGPPLGVHGPPHQRGPCRVEREAASDPP